MQNLFPFVFCPFYLCHAMPASLSEMKTQRQMHEQNMSPLETRTGPISWVHLDADEDSHPIMLRQPPVVYCQALAAHRAARLGLEADLLRSAPGNIHLWRAHESVQAAVGRGKRLFETRRVGAPAGIAPLLDILNRIRKVGLLYKCHTDREE